MALIDEHCQPIAKGTPPLSHEEAATLFPEVPGWTLDDNSLTREYRLKDFRDAFAFVNQVGVLAQAEDHHPEICINYSQVRLALTTHKIGGLSRNDFILAAKINQLS